MAVDAGKYGILPVGVVNLLYRLGRTGTSLRGHVLPSFTPPDAEGLIWFRGDASEEWLEVRTDVPNIPVSLERLAGEPFLDQLPFRDPQGRLTMMAILRLRRDGSSPPLLRARLSLADASFQPAADVPLVEQLNLELSTLFAPEAGQGLNSPLAWASTASLTGHWIGTPIRGCRRSPWPAHGCLPGPRRLASRAAGRRRRWRRPPAAPVAAPRTRRES